ncbi:MAG: endonuclease/exonuclease/phosphatase family protein [Pseudomonadota bacterium]
MTLQEARLALQDLDLPLGWDMHRCADGPVRLTAILSRHPVRARGCLSSGSWVRAETPEGDLTVATLHLYWPWPRGQHSQVRRLLPELAALPGPILLTGDMNQTPWSHTLAELTENTGTYRARGAGVTYVGAAGLVRLPIDHLLVPSGWLAEVRRLERWGADHHALALSVSRPYRRSARQAAE